MRSFAATLQIEAPAFRRGRALGNIKMNAGVCTWAGEHLSERVNRKEQGFDSMNFATDLNIAEVK